MMLAACLKAGAQISLPEIGSPAGAVLSPADEKRLGEAFMREIRIRLPVVDDPEVTEYAQSLGYRLVSHSDNATTRFTFFVLADPAINAFAAPGGFIGINSGLLLAAESESELAAVLAHEIAHVTQRHIARSIQMAEAATLPALAGMLAALVIGTQSADAGAAAAAAVTAGQAQQQINFTRENEREADRVGMTLLHEAGFEPRSMPAFFERLQQSFRYYSQPPEFLSTHPVTVSRIADTRNRAEQYASGAQQDSIRYQMVREKLRVGTATDPKLAVRHYQEALERAPKPAPVAVRYGYALALLKARHATEARQVLTELVEATNGEQVPIRAALAESELAAGNTNTALQLYSEALRLYPDSPILTQGYVSALISTGQAETALNVLDAYGRYRPPDAATYKLFAQAYEQTGQSAHGHLALAEYFYLNGRLDEAMQQLRLGRQQSPDEFYQRARIEARLEEIKTEQAERARR
jgi:predicted Zn-dependent protease